MAKKRDKEPIDLSIKPAGSYIGDLSDFADLLGTIDDAEKAAKTLLEETAGSTASSNDGEIKTAPDFDALMAELDALVGLTKIKEGVKSLVNLVRVRAMRRESGLAVPPISLHMVFMGNPGTGKTTVARILAGLYHAIGVVSKGQLIEVDRGGLVAGYVGQTAVKTGEVIKSALGGILFIDEAYSLVSGEGGNDFGHEAIETLLKAMEDNRQDLVVIVAGYDELMERFISSNPGLESRFNRYLVFEDYNGAQLYEIFQRLCQKHEYKLSDDAAVLAKAHFIDLFEQRDDNFGNARDVRNFFENAVSVHSDRLSQIEKPTVEELMTFECSDLDKAAEF